ncbi:DNA polymerase III subunit delta [Halpernia frigidisoli]|uniref:DNA polymerase III subunit delta n=1 Tax=Halpernia frigidisoli TaxID=1125876 RepID=A0A1I3CYT5_9FLAO|nr:DNA polymerase III subunit delta [Halpernia frigidisoli]SFH79720.1 DNA polymerase III, delta subunit [Halpernia frigidisoli]
MKDLNVILKSIKNKAFLPVYFFHGEESYFIDVAVKSLENDVLTEDEKAFNQIIVYGKDSSYAEICSLARQFPMIGDKQVIIVKEAQDLKSGEDDTKPILAYLENPVESTILVFGHKNKKIDGRKAFGKVLAKKQFLFLSEKLKDGNLVKWISDECKELKIKTSPNIPNLLAEYLGDDLSRIANELKKLQIVLKENEVLDEKLVELHIGISKDYNVFELINALSENNASKSLKIAHYMGKNVKLNPIVLSLGNLYTFFSNLIMYQAMAGQNPQTIASETGINPYAIRFLAIAARHYNLRNSTRIISLLRETDLKSKGLGAVNVGDDALLNELVFKILNINSIKVLH